MSERQIIVLNRDTFATLVPSGAHVMLHQGTEVTITQQLGNSFTVNVYGNLARIESKDADALGREVPNPLADLPPEATVEEKVWVMLRKVFDPEIPVNIVDLGLVYDCQLTDIGDNAYDVHIHMTLTAPGCGMGPVIADDAKEKVLLIPEVTTASVEIVFDPPWDQSMMSDAAKLELGLL